MEIKNPKEVVEEIEAIRETAKEVAEEMHEDFEKLHENTKVIIEDLHEDIEKIHENAKEVFDENLTPVKETIKGIHDEAQSCINDCYEHVMK